MAAHSLRKQRGAYYTPDPVVSTLLQWAVRNPRDRLIDPSCGDGRFIAGHRNSVGIEQDTRAAGEAIARAPWAVIYDGDFFAWASATNERFDCATGNPPFIRYQYFSGESRARAIELCARLGADFTGLASSWAPFLVATAGLLRPGGRLAFVVPAEIGHAPYAAPLVDYLVDRFAVVHIVAIREKFFPELSEDCWLLYAEGFGSRTDRIQFSIRNRFELSARPPQPSLYITVLEWRSVWNRRLRPFLVNPAVRELYQKVAAMRDTRRFGDVASIGIGYVSGANEFFHLRPSEAERREIPSLFLYPTVRNGRSLPAWRLTQRDVEGWKRDDRPILLLKIPKAAELPNCVNQYLQTDAARKAQAAYKCRVREPWYSVPDVRIPDYFLTYMSGVEPGLVRNDARCTCTNSVHGVDITAASAQRNLATWGSQFVQLSCELEGHPLGGGMLKLEPREAAQIVLPTVPGLESIKRAPIRDAIETMREWRHYAPGVRERL